ncbi:cation:proton antiporter domain-containing protein [Halorubrum vacuolatum]|uniref:Sodium/proton antiporter, CPA1 family n=1 Tax=Halorubrum vacuolatum TaxID=63740 RepID=A0A238VNS8_HALVU|nr:cation:proton antiporter [Halorubrum vacuolatum]SNR35413.1 sodium/proton antiporter, CPA1 family [Halorubrum vacuolatum]
MSGTLPVITAILAIGIALQVVASRVRVPSVLFLILVGVLIGPEGLGFVTAETFGDGLSTVVGLSVAIIVFEGGFHLRRDRLNEAPTTIKRMITVGALVMFLGTALAVRLFLTDDWGIAFLIGALLIATGPTVITPILQVIDVRGHVASTLEAEGILNDVTAAVLAIVVFETIVVANDPTAVPVGFLTRLVAGIGVGMVVASAVYVVLIELDAPGADAKRTVRLVTLGGAFVAYGLAESVAPETGVAAAAAAGVLLGNVDLPHRSEVEGFGRDLTLVALSFVFISLAALIEFDALLGLGIGGVAVVVAVTLVIRPVVVFISARDDAFTRNERLFVSLVGPRGIIPASVATLFAIQLEAAGEFAAAQTLAGTVFLVIFATVVLQAGLARQIAESLEIQPMKSIIIGGGRVGRALATRLENRGENVIIMDRDPAVVEGLQRDGFRAELGDGTETEDLTAAGAGNAKLLVAATSTDDGNLLCAQLARNKFDIGSVIARVNDPDNVAAFDALDVRAIDVSSAMAWTIDNEIERPTLAHWMTELGEGHDAQEVTITADTFAGRTLRQLGAEIPDGAIVAVIGRDGETFVPHGDTVLEADDRITFLGTEDAVERAVKRVHPHD